jgi:hypothetical protein
MAASTVAASARASSAPRRSWRPWATSTSWPICSPRLPTSLNLDGVADAGALAERAVPIARRLDNPYVWMILQGNIGLAALLQGDIDAAGGGDARLRAPRGGAVVDGRLEQTFVGSARRRLGDAEWDGGARAGASLSLDEAIVYALEEADA